jgi:NADH dehydrogenase
MDENKPHVVVLGGGFAGLSAAKELAKANVSVTLVDRQITIFFSLSYTK